FSPTSTMPSPGGRPAFAVNSATAGATSARISLATATPSSSRAPAPVISTMSRRLRFEPLQRFVPAEDDKHVAAADDRVRFGIECHGQIATLNADDDDAETLPQIRVVQ